MVKKMSDKEFKKALAEAQKDPQFHRDIKAFLKKANSVYKLKDFDLD